MLIGRRLVQAPAVLLAISVLVFAMLRLVPGDAISRLAGTGGGNLSPEQMTTLRRMFGLDLPLHEQFLAWLGGLAQGDLGVSLVSGRAVLPDLVGRFGATLELAVLSLLVTVLVGVPLGTFAAIHHGRAGDIVASTLGLVGIAIPNFWFATLLVLVFSVSLRWLPSAGYIPFLDDPIDSVRLMILPVLALGLAEAAVVARVTRSAIVGVLSEDHVRTARAKGLPERQVIRRHVVGTALVPIITIVGLSAGYLLSGAIIIEQIFSIPGVGRFALEGITDRDYPVVQGAVLFIALVYFGINLTVDVLVAAVDPRVRT